MGTGDVNARVCEHGSLRRQCDLCDLMQENAALRSRVERMESALRDCEEFFNERADADLPHGCDSPIPNDDMKMLAFVREALAGKATCA